MTSKLNQLIKNITMHFNQFNQLIKNIIIIII
jgi:hypothetical protein